METGTAGPAYRAAATPVRTKIRAPIIAPTPSAVRCSGPSVRRSDRSDIVSASARSAAMGLVAKRDTSPNFAPQPLRANASGTSGTRGGTNGLGRGRLEQVVAGRPPEGGLGAPAARGDRLSAGTRLQPPHPAHGHGRPTTDAA